MASFDLKGRCRAIARRIVGNDAAWSVLRSITNKSDYLRVQRHAAVETQFETRRDRAFAETIVLSGPFGGMKYPGYTSYGSALYPKLLGTYESELHGALADLLTNPHDNIVDIGFAGAQK